MAVQASIEVNAVVGSDDDLAINTLVQLSNDDGGDEATYTWSILEQPPGAADSLSSTAIENPTLTPLKEGTYLVRLVVDSGLPTEVSDQVVLGIRHLKSRIRVPAPSESTETGADGWAEPAANEALRLVDTLRGDSNVIVASAGTAGITVGSVMRFTGVATLKSGLPGEEDVVAVRTALATELQYHAGPLAVMLGTVAAFGAPSSGDLCYVRLRGLVTGVTGVPSAVGDPVYLSDAGVFALTAGTYSRPVGVVVAFSGGLYDVWFDGAADSQVWANRAVGPGVLQWGVDATGLASPTYPVPGWGAPGATEVQIPVPMDCQARNLYIKVATATHDADLTYTVRKNGVDTGLTATVAVAASTASDVDPTHGVRLSAGDLVSVSQVLGGGIGVAAQRVVVTLQLLGV